MWVRERSLHQTLFDQLSQCQSTQNLQGIRDPAARDVLAWQMVASLRRLRFTEVLLRRPVCQERIDPNSPLFDPERAAIYHVSQGQIDEAWWLVFLSTHFGKHGADGWLLLREYYGALGSGLWDWSTASRDPSGMSDWLRQNYRRFTGRFGNHRKYESLRPDANNGTSVVLRGYIGWVGGNLSHQDRLRAVRLTNNPADNFDRLYQSLTVPRFGRLARFDFLALVGRLGLAPIAPGSAYLSQATGPLRGAKLLVEGAGPHLLSAHDLQQKLNALDNVVHVGMQVMEDSLCNWQKSPLIFRHFTG